jgi:hypothetical protein
MSPARRFTAVLLGLRVAYGLGLLAAPARLATGWLGEDASTQPVKVPLRGVGGREVAVHGAALLATLGGGPVRPWLAVSVAGDVSDIAATAIGRGPLPGGAVPKTAALAGASAALTLAAAALVGD